MQFLYLKFVYINTGEIKESTRKVMITNVGMANIPYWSILPMGMSNYGGDVQIYDIPEYVNSRIGMMLNPMAQAGLNQYLSAGGVPSIQPAQINQGTVDNLARSWLGGAEDNLSATNLNASRQNIEAAKTRLNAKLQTEGISDEDKKKVTDLLERLDEQEKKLKELQENKEISSEERYKKSKEIEKAVRDIVAETSQLKIEPMAKKEEENADKADGENADNADNAEEKTAEEKAAEAKAAEEKAAEGKPGAEAAEATQTGQEPQGVNEGYFVAPEYADQVGQYNAELKAQQDAATGGVRTPQQMAQSFSEAVNNDGWWGTDNDKFEAVVKQINKDNVMPLLLAYNQTQTAGKGESFMEAFMWDANHNQKRDYGKQIADALQEKALETGVYEICKEDFKAIYDALDDFCISNDISANFDNIVERIAIKTGQAQFARPYKA